ncbi:MAG: metallophosphoesterase family protein [Bacteroidota bacterium]
MNIAILSDIHDHIWNLDKVLEHCASADALICCGDLCSPFIIKRLGDGFEKEIHLVFGNNDADLFRITRLAHPFGDRLHLYGEMGTFEIGGRSFALNHFPQISEAMAASGQYDVVCYGHNHIRDIRKMVIGQQDILLINPGPVMGVKFEKGRPTPTEASFALLETENMHAQLWGCLPDQTLQPLS